MISPKILVTGNFAISSKYLSERVIHIPQPRDSQHIIDNLVGVRHYVMGGPEYADDHLLSHARDLRHIVVMGTQTSAFLDVESALAKRILIENVPGTNADAVAEFILGMVIVNLAESFSSYQNVLAGEWRQRPHKTLSEATLGIVGMGNIGTRFVGKVRAISPLTRICYFARSRKEKFDEEYNVEFSDLKSLVKESDAVVICVNHNPETDRMIDAEILASAKDGSIILNFCHPMIVDPADLKEALDAGRVKFSYFDGYYSEWTNNKGVKCDEYNLLALGPSKFVATEHIGAQTEAVNAALLREAFAKIACWDEHHHAQAPMK